MNKKVPVSLVVAVILVAMTVTFSMTMIISQRIFNQNVSSVQEKSAMYDKLAKIDIVARNNFYGQIQDDVLMDTMAAGYVAGLGDKNNKYYTKTQYTDLLSRQAGKLMGLGFDIVKDSSSGYFKIITVYNDSPASEIGMAKSDNLTMIGEVDVRTLS
ncbi:MAG: peptidase, partial [Oscillospiraceae bacterium]